jgi:hypothetical protein
MAYPSPAGCIERAALRSQRVGNLVFFGGCTIFYRVDAVVAEVKHSVIPLQRVRFRLTLTLYDKDANLACLAQIRQRLDERARRLPASVPRHIDVLERDHLLLIVWHQEEMAPSSEKQAFDQALRFVD